MSILYSTESHGLATPARGGSGGRTNGSGGRGTAGSAGHTSTTAPRRRSPPQQPSPFHGAWTSPPPNHTGNASTGGATNGTAFNFAAPPLQPAPAPFGGAAQAAPGAFYFAAPPAQAAPGGWNFASPPPAAQQPAPAPAPSSGFTFGARDGSDPMNLG